MFQKPYVRDQDQKPNIRVIDAPSAHITWEIIRVLGGLYQELGEDTHTYISSYLTVALM